VFIGLFYLRSVSLGPNVVCVFGLPIPDFFFNFCNAYLYLYLQ